MGRVRESFEDHFLGKYIWNDASFFEGDWVDNKISGFGVYIWSDGRRYEGTG